MAYSPDTLDITQVVTVDNTDQVVDILTPRFYGQSIHNRKDSFTLKLTINTGSQVVNVLCYTSNEDDPIFLEEVSTDSMKEHIIDLSEVLGITKFWQIRLVGLVKVFELADITILYGDRPEPLTFYREVLAKTSPNKKRVRTWPIIIDTVGEDVSIIPYVDGVAQPELIVTSTFPETFLYQFITDVFGTDHAMTLRGCCGFELYGILPPIDVQELPIGQRFSQIGSAEFFQNGKIKSFSVRVISFSLTSIPFTIYFEDASQYTGSLTVVAGKEMVVNQGVPKSTMGAILRIELGPTATEFHLFNAKIQLAIGGRDTELEWTTIEVKSNQGQ